MRTRGQASTLVDTAVIATSFGFEEPKVQELLDAPTADLVKDFLLSLTSRAQDFDNVKTEKLRAEVELENTIRTSETKSKALKSSLTKSQRETEDLRKDVTSLENSKAELQAQIDQITSTSTSSTSEAETLRARIVSLEGSNREALSVLENKTVAHDKLAEELTTQHQKIVSLRRDVSSLEDQKQSLENHVSTARFREQSLLQEVDLLKKNVDWHEQELKTRSEESSKFRKEKNARIAELQRANEDASATIETLKRTEITLRQRVEEVTQKAEDAFSKNQKLQEAAIDADAAFKTELDSARRLAELQKQSAETARARLQDVTENLENIKDAAADEIGQLQAEIETERRDKEIAEEKLAELEQEIERLQAAQTSLRAQTPIPATPNRGMNGFGMHTPLRAGSPMAHTPGTARSKGNLSFTQLVGEVSSLRSDLEAEKRRTAALTQELDEMVNDLENRGPEQEDLRGEKERMEAEIVEMSSLMEAAVEERDSALAEARNWQGQARDLTKESSVLRQQLRDLSAQIRLLLVETHARDQGLDVLDAAGQAQLHMLANGQLDEDNAADQTSAGALITQRLLLFRNVSELQEQNIQLLKLNRGLADQMEGDEARTREAEQADKLKELEDLQARAERYQDEIRSLTTQAASITRERDMFRRMLAHRGPLPPQFDAESLFGQSVNAETIPMTPRTNNHGIDTDTVVEAKQLSEYAKLVKELQSHLDTIRQEASTDHSILRQQVDSLAKDKSVLQSDLARSAGQITLAHERYEMLQANYRMLQGENSELQKRSQSLNENAAKQDLRTQQVAEELVDAKALADSMRNETANLKAERDLWRKIETRLTEDNRLLMDERSRLNKMLADHQSLQNEREQADSETRRRLQDRIEALETEVVEARKRAEAEGEESKKAHLRREYEQDQSRLRIDDLIKNLSGVREELVAAKTTRDQLQTRVDEMKIDLRNAEERAQALQPRPSSGGPLAGQTGAADEVANGDLSREQELALEVADLKKDLDLARAELENARGEVEQYKTISQATEEELQSLNETNDQYREDTDRQLAEKEGVIQQLEQRIEDLNSELTTSNNELSNIRTQHERSALVLEEQKISLEGDLLRLRDECDRQTEKAKMHQQDLRAQAEIAQQAQQSYEDELLKHAEAAKSLQNVRTEYHALRTEVASIRADAEAAKASLSQGQDTWSELRDQYDRELNEMRAGREDLKSQNRLLHDQLESVSTQIAGLQQHRAQPDGEAEGALTVENAGSQLQEVITYLRREKEIIDVQYELAVQESKRTKQQLDYTQSQLDETRLKLSEERRERTGQEASAASHSKLLETINELNLYRESSATLRQESRQAQAKLQEKLKEIEVLTEQILPLQGRIREVESELETKDGELRLLQEDRDRWRERTQNIISKYDRVDPAEIEQMKSKIAELEAGNQETEGKIAELETEKEQLQTRQAELVQQIEGHAAQVQQTKEESDKAWQDQRAKFIEQAKERNRQQNTKIKELERELVAVREEHSKADEERTSSSETIRTLEEELAEVRTRLGAAEAAVQAVQAEHAQEPKSSEEAGGEGEEGEVREDEAEEGQIADAVIDGNANEQTNSTVAVDEGLQSQLQAAESRATEETLRANTLQQEIESLQTTVEAQAAQVGVLEARIVDLENQLNTALTSVTAPTTDSSIPPVGLSDSEASAQRDQLQEELNAALKELEAARSQITSTNADIPASNQSTDNATALAENEQTNRADDVAKQVEQLRAELEQQHQVSKQEMEATYETRVQGMKKQLNQKLREYRDKAHEEVGEEIRQQLILQHSEEIEKLKQTHAEEIDQLKEQHRLVVERMTKEGAEAVEKAKASATPQQTVAATNGEADKAIGPPVVVGELNLSDQQARELVQKNDVIRNIIKRNITTKVDEATKKVRDENDKNFADRLNEEKQKLMADHEKTLAETTEQAKSEKEQAITKAVNMETMKQRAKLGMAEGQARSAKAKIDIVETAARDTPQRPVVEVWEIAKAAKAAPATAPAATKPAAVAPATAQPVAVQTQATQPAAVSAATPTTTESAAAPSDSSKLAARQARFGAPSATVAGGSFGKPSATLQQPGAAPVSAAIAADTVNVGEAATPATQPTSSTTGLGRGATGLPRAGGSMLPRGGAAGRGRGGIPQPGGPTAASQIARGGATGLPRGNLRGGARGGRGGGVSPLNAGASQFVPGGPQGAKRPLEGGDQQGDGKRIRGGADQQDQ